MIGRLVIYSTVGSLMAGNYIQRILNIVPNLKNTTSPTLKSSARILLGMEIEIGTVFRSSKNEKYIVSNKYMDGELEVIVFRTWNSKRKRWMFNADFTDLFILRFEYGWYFELKRHQKQYEQYFK